MTHDMWEHMMNMELKKFSYIIGTRYILDTYAITPPCYTIEALLVRETFILLDPFISTSKQV